VIGIVEVNREAAVDEHAAQLALEALGIDARGRSDVACPDCNRALPIDRCRGEQFAGRLDGPLGVADQRTGPTGQREATDRVPVDRCCKPDPRCKDGRPRRCRPARFEGGKRVVLAGELQTVHALQ